MTDASARRSDAEADPLGAIIDRHGAGRRRTIAERNRLEALVARHRASIEKLPRFGAGTALEEIARLLAERTGLLCRVSGPFGLDNEYGLTVEERPGVSGAHFTLRPVGEDAGMELVVEDSDNGLFPEGSIGRMNGMHRNSVPLPDLDTMLGMIDERRATNRLTRAMGKGI